MPLLPRGACPPAACILPTWCPPPPHPPHATHTQPTHASHTRTPPPPTHTQVWPARPRHWAACAAESGSGGSGTGTAPDQVGAWVGAWVGGCVGGWVGGWIGVLRLGEYCQAPCQVPYPTTAICHHMPVLHGRLTCYCHCRNCCYCRHIHARTTQGGVTATASHGRGAAGGGRARQ